jgi:PilZ domain
MSHLETKLQGQYALRVRRPPSIPKINTRIAIRYVQDDFTAILCTISLLSYGFLLNKEFTVDLLDISSKGLLIATDKKLRVNQTVNICLKFDNGREFKRHGKIVHRADGIICRYGLKFDRLSNSLGDYLLAEQKKFAFK